MCASEAVEHRKNSWELYGFDFMVDADYNAWLIEINSSPACDYSTKVKKIRSHSVTSLDWGLFRTR